MAVAEVAVHISASSPERRTVEERPKAVGMRTVNAAAPAQMVAVVTVVGHCGSGYLRVKDSPSAAAPGIEYCPVF